MSTHAAPAPPGEPTLYPETVNKRQANVRRDTPLTNETYLLPINMTLASMKIMPSYFAKGKANVINEKVVFGW